MAAGDQEKPHRNGYLEHSLQSNFAGIWHDFKSRFPRDWGGATAERIAVDAQRSLKLPKTSGLRASRTETARQNLIHFTQAVKAKEVHITGSEKKRLKRLGRKLGTGLPQ